MSRYFFEDFPSAGALDNNDKAKMLREIGDVEGAKKIEQREKVPVVLWGEPDPWEHTGHAFGFISENATALASGNYEVLNALKMAPDVSLKNNRIKITLDRLRAADYPGKGMHQVLFDFYGENQLDNSTERIHFNQTFSVQEGEDAPIVSYPILIGLKVGDEGVVFKALIANVKNDDDEAIMEFLEGDTFKSGLQLATAAQPAIAPLTQLVLGVTKTILSRNRNVKVDSIDLGLDFSSTHTRAKLSKGSYICVQVPQSEANLWDWSQWVYNSNSGQITRANDSSDVIQYNYIIFSVSSYVGR